MATAEIHDIVSRELRQKLKSMWTNSVVDVFIAARPACDLEERLAAAPQSERGGIYIASYTDQLQKLGQYLYARGVISRALDGCPWFVLSALSERYMNELNEDKNSPIQQIGIWLPDTNFEYTLA